MQTKFKVDIPAKRHICDVGNCNKRFPTPIELKRHKKSHKAPMTPGSHHASNSDQQTTAMDQQPTTSASNTVDLRNMVFYDNSDDSSDEDEEDENPVAGTFDFTGSTIMEPEVNVEPEVDDSEVEDESPIAVQGAFFPFQDKIHQLLHEFYYRSGGDITQSLMSDIIKLVKDVIDAKEEYTNAKVPAADLIFNYDDPRRTNNQIPNLRQTTHQVRIVKKDTDGAQVETTREFTMSPPSEILRFLVANPALSSRLTKLPDDTPNELIDSHQSEKWRTNELFQHPMATISVNSLERDIWVGDVVRTSQFTLVVDRFFTLNHDKLMVSGHEVEELGGLPNQQFGIKNVLQPVTIKSTAITAIVCDNPAMSTWLLPENCQGNAFQVGKSLISKLKEANPLKRPTSTNPRGKFMPVKVVPLNLFTDDMSGNRTKKFNKFDSWIMVPAALPLAERNALENTSFICTDHLLSAMQMLPALVENFVKLEERVAMNLPGGAPVLVVAPFQ